MNSYYVWGYLKEETMTVSEKNYYWFFFNQQPSSEYCVPGILLVLEDTVVSISDTIPPLFGLLWGVWLQWWKKDSKLK